MFSTTSSSTTTLSSSVNQLSPLEQNLEKIDSLLQNILIIGKHKYTISEWLGNNSSQETTNPNQLHAGFQAAALARHIDEQLFFLEHLNQVSRLINDYLSFEKVAFMDQSFQVQSNDALLNAINNLSLLWKNCFINESHFKLNFSDSKILCDTSIGQKDEATAGQKKIKELHLKINEFQQRLNATRQDKASRLLGLPSFTPKQLSETQSQDIKEVITEAFAIFKRALMEVASSIQQAKESHDAAERVMKKWPKTQSPILWSTEKDTQQTEIKRVAQFIIDEHETCLQQEFKSQSPLSPRFLSPRQKNKPTLPEPVLFIAELLKKADIPFTAKEIELFETLKKEIFALKDKYWDTLKEKIKTGQKEEPSSLFSMK